MAADDIFDTFFADSSAAVSSLELVSFQAFGDTADAVAAIAACQEGRAGSVLQDFLSKRLKKLLKATTTNGKKLQLAVADKALAVSLQHGDIASGGGKKGKSTAWPEAVQLVHDDKTAELFRGIRCYMDDLLGGGDGEDGAVVSAGDVRKMQLGLAHALGRYKLKFSADKVDTMIIQAVGLLDELDKEINTYAMRVKVSACVSYVHVLWASGVLNRGSVFGVLPRATKEINIHQRILDTNRCIVCYWTMFRNGTVGISRNCKRSRPTTRRTPSLCWRRVIVLNSKTPISVLYTMKMSTRRRPHRPTRSKRPRRLAWERILPITTF